MDATELLQRAGKDLLPDLLGIRFLAADADCIRAELRVERRHCTIPGTMHGGALMALADTLGACGTALNLPEGAGTTTLESKTNFFAPGLEGGSVVGTARPLHRGGRTQVWQTEIVRGEDERRVALVTQTQIVLEPRRTPEQQMAGFFADGSPADQQALLARLERTGGSVYRAWAEAASDPDTRARLLAAADREDENAALLEDLVARDR